MNFFTSLVNVKFSSRSSGSRPGAMALRLFVSCVLALSVFVQGGPTKHVIYMRHVESEQNWATGIKGLAKCAGSKDVYPSGISGGGNGINQIKYILANFGKVFGRKYRNLLIKTKWAFESSNLRRAQITGIAARESLINYFSKPGASTENKNIATNIQNRPFEIKEIHREQGECSAPDSSSFEHKKIATYDGNNWVKKTGTELKNDYFNKYLNKKAIKNGKEYIDPSGPILKHHLEQVIIAYDTDLGAQYKSTLHQSRPERPDLGILAKTALFEFSHFCVEKLYIYDGMEICYGVTFFFDEMFDHIHQSQISPIIYM